MRREKSGSASRRSRKRLPCLTFALGLIVGVGLAGPLPSRIGSLAASLVHAPRGMAAIAEPLSLGKRHILVMGSDEAGGNTDVMFTVQLDDDVTRIIQVPRDTFIESPELGILKANALYSFGGADTAKAEVGRLIDAPVERHLRVNLDAVARLADALGGVEVDVPKRMYYVDNTQGLYIDLYPGVQLLRGEALEGFLRFRHDEMGDLGRMDRQRQVLRKVFARLAQPSMLARLPELIRIAGEDIQTDLSPLEMTQLAAAMTRSRLATERLSGHLYWYDDLSYWMPDGGRTTRAATDFGSFSEPGEGRGEGISETESLEEIYRRGEYRYEEEYQAFDDDYRSDTYSDTYVEPSSSL